jgi:modification methylase
MHHIEELPVDNQLGNSSSRSKVSFNELRIAKESWRSQCRKYVENPVPASVLNEIFSNPSESMDELPDSSVHFVVTSPPYNVGKEYDLDVSMGDHLSLLAEVMGEIHRVLVPGGRVAINVAGIGQPYIPMHHHVTRLPLEIGFLHRGEIVSLNGRGKNGSCAWRSWMSASNPVLRDSHEYILVFSKDSFKRLTAVTSTIGNEEFCASTPSLWEINSELPKRVNHPTPFPERLEEGLIRLYTHSGDVVLDPFIGSGRPRSWRHGTAGPLSVTKPIRTMSRLVWSG